MDFTDDEERLVAKARASARSRIANGDDRARRDLKALEELIRDVKRDAVLKHAQSLLDEEEQIRAQGS